MHFQEVEAYDFRSTQVQVSQAPAVLQAIDATSTHATAALQAQPLQTRQPCRAWEHHFRTWAAVNELLSA